MTNAIAGQPLKVEKSGDASCTLSSLGAEAIFGAALNKAKSLNRKKRDIGVRESGKYRGVENWPTLMKKL